MSCSVPYEIISTGSHGNAVVLNRSVLIDCGVPFKALQKHYQALQLVLLTHIHSDHFNPVTVRKLAQERPTLRFGCGPWLAGPLAQCLDKVRIDILEPNTMYNYGLFQVAPVRLTHNVPNCGYKLHFPGGKLFYATDTSSLSGIQAKGYDLYLVEANYITEEIIARIQAKKADGEYAYELEAMRNHLSKEDCDTFLYQNIDSRGEYVYMHCHQDREVAM